ncbi:hypothetical protein B0H19DRAFT_1084426 [Mycena capillaripes]|nr:hypothetical protein B0H19DRAFT_1084426 [Mycena capillaripes]
MRYNSRGEIRYFLLHSLKSTLTAAGSAAKGGEHGEQKPSVRSSGWLFGGKWRETRAREKLEEFFPAVTSSLTAAEAPRTVGVPGREKAALFGKERVGTPSAALRPGLREPGSGAGDGNSRAPNSLLARHTGDLLESGRYDLHDRIEGESNSRVANASEVVEASKVI